MNEYLFTSNTALSSYKTNLQITLLNEVMAEIYKTPLIWLGDTQAVDKRDIINIIQNKIKEIENKNAEIEKTESINNGK